ncbi:hypothetical protein PILCRDRAFT_828206 [Piloderma croceum F 1598]|nr:hypothetical protein PILCRDRAFT_828206 [Piloderma croceum F 1598]
MIAASSSSKSHNLKRTQSNLSRYFAGLSSKSSDPSSASTPTSTSAKQSRGCGGTIGITVEDDFTHPLGVKGHRVLVIVQH